MPDQDFSINVYGIDRKLCVRWVPKYEFDGRKAVMFNRAPQRDKKKTVARMSERTGLYPGKQLRSNQFYVSIAVDANTFVSDDRGEVLHVGSSCVWAWISYASADNLPVGTVVGGYDVNGEPLYVARALFNDAYSIGCYKSSTSLGYFTISGEVGTNKHILIILQTIVSTRLMFRRSLFTNFKTNDRYVKLYTFS